MKRLLSMVLLITILVLTLSGCAFDGKLPVILLYEGSDGDTLELNFSEGEILTTGTFDKKWEDKKVYATLFTDGALHIYGEGETFTSCNDPKITVSSFGEGHPQISVQVNNYNAIIDDMFTIGKNKGTVEKVYIHNGIPRISDCTFRDCDKLTYVECQNVTEIGKAAFYNCSSLEEFISKDKNSVTSLDDGAFLNCYHLKEANFPNLEKIGNWAFGLCGSLETFEVSDTVTSVGEGAFAYCGSLESVIFKGEKPELADNIFEGTEATVYIPKDNPTWNNELKNYDGENWLGGNVKIALYDLHQGISSFEYYKQNSGEETDSDTENNDTDEFLDKAIEEIKPVDWRELYKDYLAEYALQTGNSFGLFYIDDDDIPELIICSYYLSNPRAELHTVYNGEVKTLGAVGVYGSFYYKERGNLMAAYSLHQGHNSTGFTSIIDGERKYVHTFSDNALTGESPVVYTMDDEEISKTDYDKKIDELMQGMIEYDLSKMPALTQSNIDSMIK